MATCFTPVRGKVMRVTLVDECGAPDGEYGVTAGFISVVGSADVEAGDEFIEKNANGDLCVNERSPDALKRYNVTITLCEIDPELVAMMTGFTPEYESGSSGTIVGFRAVDGVNPNRFALEVWTGLNAGACTEAGACYGYSLWPQIVGATVTGDVTIENGAATLEIAGYTEGQSQWSTGPWDVIGTNQSPTPLGVAIASNQHWLMRTTCVSPPDAECGVFPIESP